MDTKAWRAKHGLNITQAAKLLGIPQPTLSRIEQGIRWPEAETLERIIINSKYEIDAGALHKSVMAARRAREAAEQAA